MVRKGTRSREVRWDRVPRSRLSRASIWPPRAPYRAHGHGRSAAAMCAAVVRAGLHLTWREAPEHLREQHPGVRPCKESIESMRIWAERG